MTGWLPALLAWLAAAAALLPLGVALANLRPGALGFRRPDADPPPGTSVSILIPARDEEAHIARAITTALASTGVTVEVVVFDDQSADGTAAIVSGLAAEEPRLRLLPSSGLPPGWAGKQHACAQLAAAARYEVLMFIDADVSLAPLAAARAAGLLLSPHGPELLSGFPQQHTRSFAEHLVVPWIHVLLLGYLPMAMMRERPDAAFAAGCGQWMVARRWAYRETGGHGAMPLSRHDGLSLPRTFRDAGLRTDLFDGTGLAGCRMYRSFDEVWHGFGKSAGEGMATARALPVWTLLIGLGHIVPWLALLTGLITLQPALVVPGLVGVAANVALRVLLLRRLRQHRLGALLHPLGAVLVLAIQWQALARHLRQAPSRWKGRAYPPVGRVDAATRSG